MNVQVERDVRVLEVAIDKVVDVVAVVDQQQLADQLVVGRYRAVLGFFAAERPVHLLDEVDLREGTVDLGLALGPALEFADLEQLVMVDQAVAPGVGLDVNSPWRTDINTRSTGIPPTYFAPAGWLLPVTPLSFDATVNEIEEEDTKYMGTGSGGGSGGGGAGGC